MFIIYFGAPGEGNDQLHKTESFLEKLLKKYPVFYGTPRFAEACLPLDPDNSTPYFFKIHFNILLTPMSNLPSGHFQ
jgi:hypothetical protein